MLATKAIVLQIPTNDADGKEGDVTALFSTLNVVDKDGDVTLPGAFENGAPVRITAYMHNTFTLPVGRGQIFADTDKAVMRGRFFLESGAGKDHYIAVKELGSDGLQEWSYEYDVLESEPGAINGQPVNFLKRLKVYGVSPVYRGAGVDTTTLDVKSFSEDGDRALSYVVEYVKRARERVVHRAKEGRTLSTANRSRLASLAESMGEVVKDIVALLDETDPEKSARELDQLYNQFVEIESQALGVTVTA